VLQLFAELEALPWNPLRETTDPREKRLMHALGLSSEFWAGASVLEREIISYPGQALDDFARSCYRVRLQLLEAIAPVN
jgi:hypothetical protein